MTTIALGIPHTPWVPARAESMARLREGLNIHGTADGVGADSYREFTDRAPNSVWCGQFWTWLHETGADWCLQLQDDVMVAPCFWPALRAMLAALPPDADVVGLTSVHPAAPEIARQGHRWYRTPGNVVGWAYAIRRDALGEFLEARTALPESFRQSNEDMQLAKWCEKSGHEVWHPVPTIADHDTSVPSSYANDGHAHRRPQVTWRAFTEGELTDPTWWKPSGAPELLQTAEWRSCWHCTAHRPAKFQSASTGAGLCTTCMAEMLGFMLRRM
jgi:hypothetical protein